VHCKTQEIQSLGFALNGCARASPDDEIAATRFAPVNGKTVPGPPRESEIAASLPGSPKTADRVLKPDTGPAFRRKRY